MIEAYKLTFTHYAVDEKSGEKYKLDDPVIVQQIFDRRYGGGAMVLNCMFEQMKQFILNKVSEEIE